MIGSWLRYGQSKLANVLYARELAERYLNILSLSIHPGVIKTSLISDLGWADKLLVYVTSVGQMLTPEEGV